MTGRKRPDATIQAGSNDAELRRESGLDTGAARMPPDDSAGGFEYRVASLAWEKGLAENSILRELDLGRTPENFMRVRRALQGAVSHGLVQLNPPRNEQLERELVDAFPSLRKDHVHVAIDGSAACLAAARLLAHEVDNFLYRSDKTEMIIANAGGKTVGETVRYLQRLVPVPPQVEGKEMTFLSLNSAEIHDQFDQCANFISVRLAQIYHTPTTRHFAVVKPFDGRTKSEYREKLDRIDLVVSSAGGRQAFLYQWLHRRNQQLPEGAVGDVAFHLIDYRGKQVQLPPKMKNLFEEELARAPDWEDLIQLFNHEKVLLVLAGAKLEVSRALLGSALARRCIFDARLAEALLGERRKPEG
jgi:DNA-binding transcriptional regulator LsrR (DeoR family)